MSKFKTLISAVVFFTIVINIVLLKDNHTRDPKVSIKKPASKVSIRKPASEETEQTVLDKLGVTKINSWSEEILADLYEDAGEEWDDLGGKLSSSVFESLTDIDLFKTGVGDGQLKIGVERRVFDNYDFNGSWTVVDSISAPITFPISLYSGVMVNGVNIGASLTTTLGLESTNIRQVKTDKLDLIPNINFFKDNLKENVEEIPEKLLYSGDFDEDNLIVLPDDDDLNEKKSFLDKLLNFNDPELIARYGDYLNLFYGPLRIPVTPKLLKRMDINEISSYSLNGTLQVGASVGWGFKDVALGAGVSTYLLGKFKVSILKVSPEKVHLKVTRSNTKGIGASIGSTTSDFVAFKGFVVLDRTILTLKENVIPFNLSLNKNIAKTFDIGYEFDLTNERSMRALRKAMFGSLSDADELSNIADGVKKLFTRDQVSHQRKSKYKMQLAFFMEREKENKKDISSALITLPDGTHKIFKGVNTNTDAYDTLWNMSEEKIYTFNMTADKDAFELSDDSGLGLIVTGKISDSHTTGIELDKYISEVESVSGQKGMFPRQPIYMPKIPNDNLGMGPYHSNSGSPSQNEHNRKFSAKYGRTSFYYKIAFTRDQIYKFKNTNTEEKWSILEKAFDIKEGAWSSKWKRAWWNTKYSLATALNLPLKIVNLHIDNGGKMIHANRFRKNWEKLADINSAKELTEWSSKLFSTSEFSAEFLKAIRITLEGDEISFYISGKSGKTFGTIVQKGVAVSAVDKITHVAATTINFDRIGRRKIKTSTQININKFHVKENSDGSVTINYILSEVPEYVFFRVDNTSNWSSFRNKLKVVVANRGKNSAFFKAGENSMTLSRDETHPLKKLISESIFNSSSSYKTLHMAVSMDQIEWGGISSSRFKLLKKKNRR